MCIFFLFEFQPQKYSSKKWGEVGLGLLQWASAAREDSGLAPSRRLPPAHVPPAWLRMRETEWGQGGGAVTGESAEVGVGGAAQVQSPLLSDGALKLGRRKELHSVGEAG